MRAYIREQLEKEMTRKQFLQLLAGLFLAIFGFHNIVSFLIDPHRSQSQPLTGADRATHGFGSSKFGA